MDSPPPSSRWGWSNDAKPSRPRPRGPRTPNRRSEAVVTDFDVDDNLDLDGHGDGVPSSLPERPPSRLSMRRLSDESSSSSDGPPFLSRHGAPSPPSLSPPSARAVPKPVFDNEARNTTACPSSSSSSSEAEFHSPPCSESSSCTSSCTSSISSPSSPHSPLSPRYSPPSPPLPSSHSLHSSDILPPPPATTTSYSPPSTSPPRPLSPSECPASPRPQSSALPQIDLNVLLSHLDVDDRHTSPRRRRKHRCRSGSFSSGSAGSRGDTLTSLANPPRKGPLPPLWISTTSVDGSSKTSLPHSPTRPVKRRKLSTSPPQSLRSTTSTHSTPSKGAKRAPHGSTVRGRTPEPSSIERSPRSLWIERLCRALVSSSSFAPSPEATPRLAALCAVTHPAYSALHPVLYLTLFVNAGNCEPLFNTLLTTEHGKYTERVIITNCPAYGPPVTAMIGNRVARQSPLTDASFVAVQPEAWAGIGQSTLMAKAVAYMPNPRRVCFDMGDDSQHDNPSSTARLAALSLTYVILPEWTRVQRFTIHRAHTFPFAKVNIFLPSARYLLVFGPFPRFSSTSCHTRNRHNSRLSPTSGHELDLRKPARDGSTKWGRHSDPVFSNGIHDDDGRNPGLRRSHRPDRGHCQPSSSRKAATTHSSSSDPWGLMLKCLRALLADPAFQEAQDNEGVQAILPFGPDGTLWPTGKAAQSPAAADLANVAGIPHKASGCVGNVPHAATAAGTSVAAAGPSVPSASGTSVASAAVASEADLVAPAPNVAHSNASGSCLSDTAQAGLIDLALHLVGPRSRIRFTTVERMTDGFGVCAPCGEWWMRR